MGLFFILIIILSVTGGNHYKKADRLISFNEVKGKQTVRISFWGQVKATTMLGTVVAILAIDFPSIF